MTLVIMQQHILGLASEASATALLPSLNAGFWVAPVLEPVWPQAMGGHALPNILAFPSSSPHSTANKQIAQIPNRWASRKSLIVLSVIGNCEGHMVINELSPTYPSDFIGLIIRNRIESCLGKMRQIRCESCEFMFDDLEKELITSFPKRQQVLLGQRLRDFDCVAEGFPSQERMLTGTLTVDEWTNICNGWFFLDNTELLSIVPELAQVWADEIFTEDSPFISAYHTFLFKTQIIEETMDARQRRALWEFSVAVFQSFARFSFDNYGSYSEYPARWICTFNSLCILWSEMGDFIRNTWTLKDHFSAALVLKFYQGLFEGLESMDKTQGENDIMKANKLVAMTNTCHIVDYDNVHFPVPSQESLSWIVQMQQARSSLANLENHLTCESDLDVARKLKSACEEFFDQFNQRCLVMERVIRANSLFGDALTWEELIGMTS
ncbi:MAG: hypothetical protein ACO1RA_10145 [Planctomycetaceae bacterium]